MDPYDEALKEVSKKADEYSAARRIAKRKRDGFFFAAAFVLALPTALAMTAAACIIAVKCVFPVSPTLFKPILITATIVIICAIKGGAWLLLLRWLWLSAHNRGYWKWAQ